MNKVDNKLDSESQEQGMDFEDEINKFQDIKFVPYLEINISNGDLLNSTE